jgi:hypothetical protein
MQRKCNPPLAEIGLLLIQLAHVLRGSLLKRLKARNCPEGLINNWKSKVPIPIDPKARQNIYRVGEFNNLLWCEMAC